MLITFWIFPVIWATVYSFLSKYYLFSSFLAHLVAISFAYSLTYLETVPASKKDGYVWPALQRAAFWRTPVSYFPGTLSVEKPLDDNQLYIFANFPHGACSINHILTMTDCCEMLSKHYRGPRRDLCASILHWIPLLKDILLFLGCIDAGASTAKHNLKKGRSILIYVGGEKEQLMTKPNEQKIYIKHRKGFIKLALQFGAHLVPMYCFGENEVFSTTEFLMGFRLWLQKNFSIGITLSWGQYGLPIPYRVPLHMEIGSPIVVQAKPSSEITDQDIHELHEKFMHAMKDLFDRTKVKYPTYKDAQLELH